MDMSLVGGDAGYNIQDLFRESHWVTYEGGLRMVNQLGNPTQILGEVETVFFDVQTWGSDPNSGSYFTVPDEIEVINHYVDTLRTSGVKISSPKSNSYGYLSAY